MSSEVEICNLALAQLGDSATLASIDPPEGSAQAEHCARWYPIARDSLLELHDWPFATRRASLAAVVSSFTEWPYAYAKPADALKIVAILSDDAGNDYSAGASPYANYTPQPFTVEIDGSGNDIILTGQVSAVARYIKFTTDTSKFSPLFRDTLATYLASYLAGPILKGETGIKVGEAKRGVAMAMLELAKASSGRQQRQDVSHNVPWLAGR